MNFGKMSSSKCRFNRISNNLDVLIKITKLATGNFVPLIYILLTVDSNEKLGGSGRTQLRVTSYCLASWGDQGLFAI
jgi:hypothetical protein